MHSKQTGVAGHPLRAEGRKCSRYLKRYIEHGFAGIGRAWLTRAFSVRYARIAKNPQAAC